jgi:uncharacterized membrane protein (DUF485 family)
LDTFISIIPLSISLFLSAYITYPPEMKFSRALLALPALSNVAFAAPFTNGELQATNQSPNPEEEVKAHLEKRLTCQSVARAIWVGHGVLEAAYVLIQLMPVVTSRRWGLIFLE